MNRQGHRAGLRIGFDVGGTTVKYGLVDGEDARLTSSSRVLSLPSYVRKGPDATLDQISQALAQLRTKFDIRPGDIEAVGLAVAGPATLDGVLHFSGNFGKKWNGVPIRQRVEDRLDIPASFENDANAAGLGERHVLLRRRPSLAQSPGILFTVGTGLGSAFFGQNGELLRGATGGGGEFGHIPMPYGRIRSSVDPFSKEMVCNCGRKGCAELFISRSFLDREVKARREEDPNNPVYADPKSKLWVEAVPAEAARGNRFALSIIKDQAYNLGLFMGRQIFTHDPRWVIIGGGISSAASELRDVYMTEVLKGVKKEINPFQLDKVMIQFAALGNQAGWFGATISAKEYLERGCRSA